MREDGERFCVAVGHESTTVDGVEVARVVERRETFTLMEKIGLSGEVARKLDRRRERDRG